MSKTVGEFIFELAKKAGISEEDEALKKFAQDKDLFTKNLPDTLDTAIDNQLVSIKDAKNNHPEIKNFYLKQSLTGMDNVVKEYVDKFALDEAAKLEISNETNTYKKVPLLIEKINEVLTKKSAAGKGDKDTIQKQIDELHTQLADKEKLIKAKETEYSDQLKAIRISSKLDSLTGAYKTTLDDLDPEVKNTTIKTLLNKNLQDNQAQLAFDENGTFVLLKKDGTNYYGDNHQQVEPKAFLERILSQNKLLKVSDQTQNGNGDQKGQTPLQNGSGRPNEKNHTLSGLAQAALKDIETSKSQVGMG